MKSYSPLCLIMIVAWQVTATDIHAQNIDSASYQSIAKAFQMEIKHNPSVFPFESFEGGKQNYPQGFRSVYFGYGERRYSDRYDFHPAMDVGYFPREKGHVETADGKTWEVRSPQSYLKKIYAIQEGLLVSAAKNISGYKIILKHQLNTPYFDDQGRAYHEYFTSYRHVDSRSLEYLSELAKNVTGDDQASVEDIVGKHIFEAGDLIAYAGFDPNSKVVLPRSHLDFSLHVFLDAKKGSNIRKYSVNPLLLFPPLKYANPKTHVIGESGVPAYRFVINQDSIVAPTKHKDGKFLIEIHAGGVSGGGSNVISRYYALDAMQVSVTNDDRELAVFTLDRQQKTGYDASTYNTLDNPNISKPYFNAPLDEQGDVYRMETVLPRTWFGNIQYDWSKSGSVSVKVSSIWDGYLDGHYSVIDIPMPREH